MEHSHLNAVLAGARRRTILQIAVEEISLALALGFSVMTLLLVIGAQLLQWYWPVALAAGTVGLVAMRGWRRIPSQYLIAQRVDRRLHLADTLSTALHFSGPLQPDTEVIRAQRENAEAMARSIDVSEAVPLRWPRAAWLASAAALVALTLFGLRYWVTRRLDLQAPLVTGIMDVFSSPSVQPLARRAPIDKRMEFQLESMGVALDDDRSQVDASTSIAPDAALATPDIPDVNDLPQQKDLEGKGAKGTPSSEPSGEGEGTEEGDTPGEGGEKNGQEGATGKPENGNAGQPPADGKQGQSGENSSLLDKMRDAFANMMNKMKMPQRGGQARQMANAQKGGEQMGRRQDGSSQTGERRPGDPEGGSPSGDAQADREGQPSNMAQGAQGGQSEAGADRQASNDAKSGMGKQDGSKDIKDAEQMAAMGKISEIFGKRAANITGEVMVEVPSGKQQLRTPYSQRRAAHAEAGGEIHRDEVPLMYQEFVQQYFEQVRKAESPAPPAPTGSKPPAPAAVKK